MTRRTLKLTIAYDGTRYAGWQLQADSPQHTAHSKKPKPTIQGTLETALRRMLQEPVRVRGSGRTDAGAHAQAQAAHIRIRSAMPRARLLRAVNHLLPSDLAVTRIDEAPSSFHAQHDAAGKSYRYRIFTGEVAPPFIRPYVHQVRNRLNIGLMRREALALRGRHNFSAFAKAEAARRYGGTRTIRAVQLRRQGAELHLEVEGDGFLHTMVRSIAGTLIDIGRGRLPPGTVRRMLRTKRRDLAGITAPAKGLMLLRVTYPFNGKS